MSDPVTGAALQPRHFGWRVTDRVATITLDRPERKNPLSLESYRELTDTFLSLQRAIRRRKEPLSGASSWSRWQKPPEPGR